MLVFVANRLRAPSNSPNGSSIETTVAVVEFFVSSDDDFVVDSDEINGSDFVSI
jgi:hypothetical protein